MVGVVCLVIVKLSFVIFGYIVDFEVGIFW